MHILYCYIGILIIIHVPAFCVVQHENHVNDDLCTTKMMMRLIRRARLKRHGFQTAANLRTDCLVTLYIIFRLWYSDYTDFIIYHNIIVYLLQCITWNIILVFRTGIQVYTTIGIYLYNIFLVQVIWRVFTFYYQLLRVGIIKYY